MIRYAWRSLLDGKGRLALSVGGVALALALVVALDAVFLGAERQLSAYVDQAGAEVIVSQAGVRTMHMGASALPASLAAEVGGMPGVAGVTPVRYLSDIIRIGNTRSSAYVIGLPPDATSGRPPRIAAGAAIPAPGGAVIDRGLAERAGLRLGDAVTVLGQPFRIDGLSDGTASLANSVVVLTTDDVARLTGTAQSVSFLFVRVDRGRSAGEVAATIAAGTSGTTVQTRRQFATEERRLLRDMGAGVIALMNFFGFLVGLAVMALTVYLATLARRAEYGVLKALGVRNRQLYRVVLTQAVASVVAGLLVAVALTVGLSLALPLLGSNLALALGGGALLKAGGAALLIAGLSALLPIRQVAGLDPAAVYRRR